MSKQQKAITATENPFQLISRAKELGKEIEELRGQIFTRENKDFLGETAEIQLRNPGSGSQGGNKIASDFCTNLVNNIDSFPEAEKQLLLELNKQAMESQRSNNLKEFAEVIKAVHKNLTTKLKQLQKLRRFADDSDLIVHLQRTNLALVSQADTFCAALILLAQKPEEFEEALKIDYKPNIGDEENERIEKIKIGCKEIEKNKAEQLSLTEEYLKPIFRQEFAEFFSGQGQKNMNFGVSTKDLNQEMLPTILQAIIIFNQQNPFANQVTSLTESFAAINESLNSILNPTEKKATNPTILQEKADHLSKLLESHELIREEEGDKIKRSQALSVKFKDLLIQATKENLQQFAIQHLNGQGESLIKQAAKQLGLELGLEQQSTVKEQAEKFLDALNKADEQTQDKAQKTCRDTVIAAMIIGKNNALVFEGIQKLEEYAKLNSQNNIGGNPFDIFNARNSAKITEEIVHDFTNYQLHLDGEVKEAEELIQKSFNIGSSSEESSKNSFPSNNPSPENLQESCINKEIKEAEELIHESFNIRSSSEESSKNSFPSNNPSPENLDESCINKEIKETKELIHESSNIRSSSEESSKNSFPSNNPSPENLKELENSDIGRRQSGGFLSKIVKFCTPGNNPTVRASELLKEKDHQNVV